MARAINAAGRSWAVGMTWRSFPDKPRMAELREDAADLSADWVAVRVTPHAIQAGFCPPIDGRSRPRGLFSLAAAVADSQQQPWLGIYRIADDLWWYIAVRDGQAVLPDGDVVGDEAAIRAARGRHESYSDWNYAQGTLDDLVALLEAPGRKRSFTPIRSLAPRSLGPPIAAAGAVLVVAAIGAWAWHRQAEAEHRARLAAMAAERARLAAERQAISPLAATPAPSAWLAACQQVLGTLPVASDGWAMTGVSCQARSVQAVWRRLSGATVANRPPGALLDRGNEVEQTIPLPPMQPGWDNAAGLPASVSALYALLQPLGVQAVVSAPATPPRLPGAGVSNKPLPIPQEAVRFPLPVSPFRIDFGQVPGLRLQSVSMSSDGWIVSGVLYGR